MCRYILTNTLSKYIAKLPSVTKVTNVEYIEMKMGSVHVLSNSSIPREPRERLLTNLSVNLHVDNSNSVGYVGIARVSTPYSVPRSHWGCSIFYTRDQCGLESGICPPQSQSWQSSQLFQLGCFLLRYEKTSSSGTHHRNKCTLCRNIEHQLSDTTICRTTAKCSRFGPKPM